MKVRLLGPVEASDDNGSTLDVRGARPRALLARLALSAGEVVTAGQLVTDLWGEEAPTTNALHTLVSRLRRDLNADGTLRSLPAGYALVLARADVDALLAQDLTARAQHALRAGDHAAAVDAAREGLALFRGPALADIGDPPYAAGAGAALDQLRLGLLEDGSEALLNAGGRPDLAELAAAATDNPLRERLQGLLIRALYADGRQADALAAYDRTRRRLADELGVDPSPALEQIHLAVLRQDAGLAPPAPPNPGPEPVSARGGNLRTPLTSFVGRDVEVAGVLSALQESRLVSLVGPGGAGKTRLALEAGRRLAQKSGRGVWLVELAPVHDPLDLPAAVLSALGLRERALLETRENLAAIEPGDAMSRLLDGLSAADVVVILDNCEHLVSAVAQLADQVLAACPDVRLMTTTREPLGITGETLRPLPPLDLPPLGADPAAASSYAAVRLFADRAAAVHPGFAVNAASVDPVVSIVRRLDGLPLAIELAAARMRAMSPDQIAARLDDRFRLLTGGSRTALPRHRTLLAVVEWSWDLLEKPERVLLQRLAVFAGPVTLETVEQICPDDDLAVADILDLLATLVDKSLVEALGASEVRYRLLETVRAFGADRLTESGEAAVVRDRHAAYLLELVETADPHMRGRDELHWLARLDAVRDDIIAALRWCIDSGQADFAMRFVAGLGWYLHLRGMTTELGSWPREVLALGGEVDPAAKAIAQTFAAMGLAGDGDLGAGGQALQEAIAESAAVRDRSSHPILALLAPAARLFEMDYEGGLAEVDEVVERHPDPWTRGVALILQGHAMENVGDMSQVADCYRRAFAIFSSVGERWGQAIALSSLGEVQEGEGAFEDAQAGYERSLAYLRELGTADDVTMTLARLARMRIVTGDLDGAERALVEAAETVQRFQSPNQAVMVEVGYSELALQRGDLDEAERRLRSVALGAKPGGGYGPWQLRAMVVVALARLMVRRGRLDEAETPLLEALAYARRSNDVPIISEVVAIWAAYLLAAGRADDASRMLGVSVGIRGLPLPSRGERAELAEQLRATTDRYDEEFAAGAELDQQGAMAALLALAGHTEAELDALVRTP